MYAIQRIWVVAENATVFAKDKEWSEGVPACAGVQTGHY